MNLEIQSWFEIQLFNCHTFLLKGEKKKERGVRKRKKILLCFPYGLNGHAIWIYPVLLCIVAPLVCTSIFFYSASALIGKKQSWCKHNNSQLQLYILQWYDLFTESRRYQVFEGFFTVLPHMVWERSWCEAGSHKLSVVHEQWTLLLIQEDEVLLQP